MTTLWIPSITLCCSPSIQVFIHLEIFHSVSISSGFIPFVVVMLLHAFINLHVWLILIRVLVSNLLGRDIWVLRWLTFWLSQAFLTCKEFFYLIRVWYVTTWLMSKNVSHTPIYFMHTFSQKQDIDASVCSYSLKIIHVSLLTILLYLMCASEGLASWMTS